MQTAFVALLTVISTWRVLTFTFWKDDWPLLWGALHFFETYRAYWSHPATVVEFMWLVKVFHVNPLPWMMFGILLRFSVAIALVKFIKQFSRSNTAAWLSGILFAVSVAGIDAVGWPSAHVVLISASLLLIGLRYLLEKNVMLFTLFTLSGFFMDPFRNVPVFLIIPFLTKRKDIVKAAILVPLIASAVAFFPFRENILHSPILTYPFKLYSLGNIVNSLFRLTTGWFIWFSEDASTGIYNRLATRIAVVLILASVFYRNVLRRYFFGLFWMMLFYIPNWLFEPKLTAGITHRYMVLSNVGFVMSVALFLSDLKNKKVQYLLVSIFVVCNVLASWHYTSEASVYRNKKIIDAIWVQVNESVPKYIDNAVFIYTGRDPVKTYAMELSGGYPIALLRQSNDVPITGKDSNYIIHKLCTYVLPLNHIFAFSVANSGSITNTTMEARRNLLQKALEVNCVPIIDQELLKEN